MKKNLIFVFFILCIYALSFAASPGDIIITEYMANPTEVSDVNGEYFEIYNTTNADIDINGWVVKDNDGESLTIENDGGLIIPSKGFLVFGRGELGNSYNHNNYDSIGLANSADEIILEENGTVICEVSYTDGDPFGAGISCELNDITNNENGVTLETSYVASQTVIPYDGDGGTDYDDFGSPGFAGDTSLPVTLSSFTAAIFQNEFVAITWITQSESSLSHFNLYRDMLLIHSEEALNQTTETIYQFVDTEVSESATYEYTLESVGFDGDTETIGTYNLTVTFGDDGEFQPDLPENTNLMGNFPNPFNPRTEIYFTIAENEVGNLAIYNVKGQEVFSKSFNSGEFRFNWDAEGLESGVYFYKLESPSLSKTKKMLLLK